MRVAVETVGSDDVLALLEEHVEEMRSVSPPESKHAFNTDALRAPEVSFFVARDERELLGCGALLDLGGGNGEIKSMRTQRRHLRRGVASAILSEILAAARRKKMRHLFLETGSQDHFEPARKLYERFGFTPCGPFGAYANDPNSVFMTLPLNERPEHSSPAPRMTRPPRAGSGLMKRLLDSGSRFEAEIGYSRAVFLDGRVYVSGTTGFDYATMTIPKAVVEQAGCCVANLATALHAFGCSLDDVVCVRYMLRDASDFPEVWPCLRSAFGAARPAATMIECGLADPKMKIEIEADAVVGAGSTEYSVLHLTAHAPVETVANDTLQVE